MNSATEIRGIAPAFVRVLSYAPSIRPDLSEADLHITAAIMLIVISQGINTREEIQAYLNLHHSPYSAHVIDFMLIGFAGEDIRHSLWRKAGDGRYSVVGPVTWLN